MNSQQPHVDSFEAGMSDQPASEDHLNKMVRLSLVSSNLTCCVTPAVKSFGLIMLPAYFVSVASKLFQGMLQR